MENYNKPKKNDIKGFKDEITPGDIQNIQTENIAAKNTEKESLKEAQLEEYTALLKRIQADFENYKKRSEKEIEEKNKYAVAQFISKLLPILDSFELALKKNNKSADSSTSNTNNNAVNNSNFENNEKFRQGMELIHTQLLTMLKKEGVEEIKSISQKFNPFRHEAIMKSNDFTAEDEIILDEFQKGYVYRDIVIRTSKVKINRIEKNRENIEETILTDKNN
ncbi:MAG TPA: nucleotide exchange factor GrpE [Candidatus Nanoarchaeia archaeon]|nr:nucleotide exchange factor GrpE [Candidatus Nanoarchaeia archaeon]